MRKELSIYHPEYSPAAFALYTAKIRQFEKMAEQIAAYPTLKRREAHRKHERMLNREFGSVSSQEFDYRLNLIAMWKSLHRTWTADGMRIANSAEPIDALREAANVEPLSFPQSDLLPTVYVHFGDDAPLSLGNVAANVEGVYVRPTQRSDFSIASMKNALGGLISFPPGEDLFGTNPVFGAVCRRNAKLDEKASLEALILNQSAMVFSHFVDGKFEVICGDANMVNDPAVELANRMAMHAYSAAMLSMAGSSRVA